MANHIKKIQPFLPALPNAIRMKTTAPARANQERLAVVVGRGVGSVVGMVIVGWGVAGVDGVGVGVAADRENEVVATALETVTPLTVTR